MSLNLSVKLIKKEELKSGIFKFTVDAKQMAEAAKPGQFLNIRCTDTIEPFLRRPISIYNIDKEAGILEFIFQVKGKGTDILAKKEIGEYIDVLGPLGHGTFEVKEYKNIAILGGGIGTFPLYELTKQLSKLTNVNTYLGFRNKDFVTLESEFEKVSNNLKITTDDGSYGIHGFAIDAFKKDLEQRPFDMIFACGPLPMLKGIRALAIEKSIPCQISLEEKMACGVGACLGCAVKNINKEEHTHSYGHVCKTGPVFWAEEVEI